MADATHYSCSGYVNGRICSNQQRFRRDVMESRLLSAIKSELLSDTSVEQFKSKLIRTLRKPKADHAHITKLETEVRNYTD